MSQKETHHFQAEIQQLLNIVIHSLYTDKEIFVRELISNAADACEKLRFNQSSGKPVYQPDIAPGIALTTDDKAGTITIADTGLGMTHGELVENLGTIAHSGTKAFLETDRRGQRETGRRLDRAVRRGLLFSIHGGEKSNRIEPLICAGRTGLGMG